MIVPFTGVPRSSELETNMVCESAVFAGLVLPGCVYSGRQSFVALRGYPFLPILTPKNKRAVVFLAKVGLFQWPNLARKPMNTHRNPLGDGEGTPD